MRETTVPRADTATDTSSNRNRQMIWNETSNRTPIGRSPPIVLSVTDHRRLQIVAIEALLSDPRNAGALLDEIDRAEVVEDDLLDERAVRLGDVVNYRDNLTGEQRQVRLVEYAHPDADERDVSVLSSPGAALVGLRVGQSILWPDRIGAERSYTILGVHRAGKLEALP
jgi:regulator of nucleoside diphosphate kinase